MTLVSVDKATVYIKHLTIHFFIIVADISTTLNESISCLRIVSASLESTPPRDEHSEQALYNLCKSIDGFRQSSKRLYEFISEKTKKSLIAEKNEPTRTPPRMEQIVTPSDFGQWNSIVAYLNDALLQCSETLPINLTLVTAAQKRPQKRSTTQHDILISFIDIIILLARIQFNLDEESTYLQAYEYLSTAEQMCAEKKFNEGYRWLSGSYYNLGTAMIKAELYKNAIYPLRKSSSLLEKDPERANSDEGKLQLCKRYEILGICCQKNKHFDDAIKAYRLALKRIPTSAIEKFTSRSETTAVSTMVEQDALIPKLMDRFLRASVIDPYQEQINFANEYVNLAALNPIRQGFLYECELKIWNELALKMSLSKYQLFIVDKLLQLYDKDNYPIRRARYV
jgi:tetratricopeptide (TPR) repeat protein